MDTERLAQVTKGCTQAYVKNKLDKIARMQGECVSDDFGRMIFCTKGSDGPSYQAALSFRLMCFWMGQAGKTRWGLH